MLCRISTVIGLIVGLLASPASLPARDELVFERPVVELHLPVDQQTAKATFLYRNASSGPVRILEARADCSCLRAHVSSGAIEPGQSGEVTVELTSRRRNGLDEQGFVLVTDTGQEYRLLVRVHLRSLIEVLPGDLSWKKGEAREAKEFTVSSIGTVQLHFKNATGTGKTAAELLAGAHPGSIRVRVTPPPGDRPFQGTVVVTAFISGNDEERLYGLRVRGD